MTKWEQVRIRGLTINLTDYALPFRVSYLSLWPERVAGWRSHPGHYLLPSSFPATASNPLVDPTGVYSWVSGNVGVGRLTSGVSYASSEPAPDGIGTHVTGYGYYISPSSFVLLDEKNQLVPNTVLLLNAPATISGQLNAGDYIIEAVTVRTLLGTQVATGARAVSLSLPVNNGIKISINADALDSKTRVDVYIRRRKDGQSPFSSPFFLASLTKESPFIDYTSHLQEQEFANYRFTRAKSPPAAFYAGRWFYQADRLLVGDIGKVLGGGGVSSSAFIVDSKGKVASAAPYPPSTATTMLPFNMPVTATYSMYVPGLGMVWALYNGGELQIWLGRDYLSYPLPARRLAVFTGANAQAIVQGAYSSNRLVLAGSGGKMYSASIEEPTEWSVISTALTNVEHLLRTPTAFIVCGDGPAVAVSPDGVTWTPRTLPTAPDPNHQLAIYPRGLIYHDGFAYLLTHYQANGRVNFYRANAPDYTSWQIWGNGFGGDDDWFVYVGLANASGRGAVVGYHDGWDNSIHLVGHFAIGFNSSFNDFYGIQAAPNIGNEPSARIWASSIAPAGGVHADKVVYTLSSGALFWNIPYNRTTSFTLPSGARLFIPPDASYVVASSGSANHIYSLGDTINLTSNWQYTTSPRRFRGPTTALPVGVGFMASLGQYTTYIGEAQLRTPHLYLSYSSSGPFGIKTLYYGTTETVYTSVLYDEDFIPCIAFNNAATVVLYKQTAVKKLLIAQNGTVQTYDAPSDAQDVVSDGANLYITAPTKIYALNISNGATTLEHTTPNARLWASGNGRLLSVAGTTVYALTKNTTWAETTLFTLPSAPLTLYDSYDDGNQLVYLLANADMYGWNGSSVGTVALTTGIRPDWIVRSDFLTASTSSSPTTTGAPRDIDLPSNTVIWTLPGYLNLTDPAYYYTFNFQASKQITAIAQHPSGVIVFADNEAYIMTGRFTAVNDTRVYPFPAPIGCDPGTQPAYRGSEIFVIWKGRVYAVSLSEAKRLSTIVDEVGDPFVQIAYDKEHDHLLARKASNRTLRYSFTFDSWFDDGEWTAIHSGPDKAIYLNGATPYSLASLTDYYEAGDPAYRPVLTQLVLESVIPENSLPQTVRALRGFGLSARTQGPSQISIQLESEHGGIIATGQLMPHSTGSPDGISRWQVMLPPYIADSIARATFSISTFVADVGQVYYGYHERKRPT